MTFSLYLGQVNRMTLCVTTSGTMIECLCFKVKVILLIFCENFLVELI